MEPMTIRELAAQAAVALSEAQVGQASGRVSDVPSPRTIRYYTTHGLLDPPSDFRGRTALYEAHHLLQLVAIKRLQARGASLVEVQERLMGASREELEAIARMPSAEPSAKPAPEEGFWRRTPAEVAPSEGQIPLPLSKSDQDPSIAQGVPLEDDIWLFLTRPARPILEEDLEALRVAAEPLRRVLRARHLLQEDS